MGMENNILSFIVILCQIGVELRSIIEKKVCHNVMTHSA